MTARGRERERGDSDEDSRQQGAQDTSASGAPGMFLFLFYIYSTNNLFTAKPLFSSNNHYVDYSAASLSPSFCHHYFTHLHDNQDD